MQFQTETYTLLYPVTGEQRSRSQVVLREPDVDALEKIDESGFTRLKPPVLDADGNVEFEGDPATVKMSRIMVEALTDLSYVEVGRLHIRDFTALAEMVGPLLSKAQGSSPPPSAT